jgi:uncharacterized protein (TIGR03545 family)
LRKKGIIFLIILFLVFIGLIVIFTDRLLENKMESFGSSLIGAKVEFDGVDFSLIGLSIKWDRLQVTNPKNTWQNLFETKRTNFNLETIPLLSKKIIIENMQMGSLRFNTERQTDGKIEKKKSQKPKIFKTIQSKLEEETSRMPVFNLKKFSKKANVDSIWGVVKGNLQSPNQIDSLKKSYTVKYDEWNKKIENLPDENEIKSLQQRIESIHIEQIKTLEQLENKLSEANSIYKQIQSSMGYINSLKNDFQNDFDQIKSSQSLVGDWITQDYQSVLKIAQLPDISTSNVTKILFGERIINQIQSILEYINTARYYADKMKSEKPEKESPPRLTGQNIHFGTPKTDPSFWIKNISLSGEVKRDLFIGGNATNIVSNQTTINQPTEFSIQGQRKDKAGIQFSASLDYRDETPKEEIVLRMQNIPLSGVKLTNFSLLPYKIEKGVGTIESKVKLSGNDLLANILFNGNSINYDYSQGIEGMNEHISKLSQSIAQSLTDINFNAEIREKGGDYSFKINSNVDNLISNKLKGMVSEEADAAKEKLEKRVKSEVEKHQKELEQSVLQKEKELRDQIEKVEKQVEDQEAKLNQKKKEIEDKIENEKKKIQKQIEEEAKKKLKDLFK